MKQQFKTVVLTLAVVALAFSMASAQILPLNNFGISPPGSPFNPNGKFTSLGESGGVPGPTPNGCDLYGFRAQIDTNSAVSLGVQALGISNIPTLSFETVGSLPLFIQEQNASGMGGVGGLGCGTLLAFYGTGVTGPLPQTNYVYTIIGSAVASGGVWAPSDKNLKRKIEPIKDAMSIVERLNGFTYEYRTDERPELNLTQGRQYGFLTQEVKEVMPEAVGTPPGMDGQPADYQVMNYDMIIPVLTEAIKIQQDEIQLQDETIQKQEDKISGLEERLERLEGLLLKQANDRVDEATNIKVEGISLKQNRPNPTTGITTIEYSVPTTLNNAQLAIYDINGRLVNSMGIAAGNNSLDIDTNAMSAGVYFYAIEANGQSLARQKMVVK